MRKITLFLALFLTSCMSLFAQENLISGGDFDRANWQDYSKPDLWTFEKVKVNHLEAPSYEGNKGYCYIDITPQADGTMRNYIDGMDMKPDYACASVKGGQALMVVFWAKSENANTIQISTPWYDAEGKTAEAWTSADITLKGGVWKKYTVYTTAAPEGNAKAGLTTRFTSTNGTISFDDFAVYESDGAHEAGTVIVQLEDGTIESGDNKPEVVLENLLSGGDFDRANWQDYSKPDLWTFEKVKVNHLEAPSYEGNKGYCYVAITPQVGGKMSNYIDGMDMKPDYACMEVAAGKQLQVVFWTKSENANTLQISIPWYKAEGQSAEAWTSADIKVEGGVWKKYTVYTAAAPAETVKAGLSALFTSANGEISFDDFAVYEADGTHEPGTVVIELEDGTEDPNGGDQPADGNLFTYGDFEQMNPLNQKPMGWYIPNSTYYKLVKDDLPAETTGKQAISIFPNSDARLMTNFEGKENILAVQEGRTYNFLFYAKANSEADKLSVRFTFYGNDEVVGEPLYVVQDATFTKEWKLYSYKVKVPYDVNSASCTLAFSTDNDYMFFDDLQLYLLPEQGGGELDPIPGVVRVDNLFYLIDGDHAVVSPETDADGVNYNDGNRPSGDLVIPESIEVEGTTYPVTAIAASAFDECPAVSSVKMPATLTAIGNYAFSYCSGLETVSFPEHLTEIGNYAFYECTSLHEIVLPAALKSLGEQAFAECTGLESIEMLSTHPASITTGKDLFLHVNHETTVLKVPAGYEKVYAALQPWSDFSKIATGVQTVASAQAQVVVENGVLTVTAPQPVQVAVYALSGKTVYAARVQQTAVALEKGVYVLQLGNETRKLLVK